MTLCLRSSVYKYIKITFIQKCTYSISISRRHSYVWFFARSSFTWESHSYFIGTPFRDNMLLYANFSNQSIPVRYYCNHAQKETDKIGEPETEKKLSLVQKFKQMYRDYWYVLVPVHLITSTFWFTSFYYLAKSGVDIAGLLETIGAGENLVQKLRNGNSTMGYIAISYALYKIATPVRYTVTLGGTTLSIKYLKDWGYIKPIPPRHKLKEIIHEKKDILLEKKDNLKELYKENSYFHKLLTKLKKKEKKDSNR